MDNCGEFAASFIPRWGEYFSCVLQKGHAGDHRAGGSCLAHGIYVMEKFGTPPMCPKWPECVTILMKREKDALDLERMKKMEQGILDAQLEMIRFSLKFPFREGSD